MSIQEIATQQTLGNAWTELQARENEINTKASTILNLIAEIESNELYAKQATDEEQQYIADMKAIAEGVTS